MSENKSVKISEKKTDNKSEKIIESKKKKKIKC